MLVTQYPWLNDAYQQLALPILQQKSHHALLINYIKGSGEDKLIHDLSHRLLCQTSTNTEPCGFCHSCQLFQANNHPDYYIITQPESKTTIGVEQIRQALVGIYEKSQQGGNKVIYIENADLMTEAAANALLKTLEEPPSNTFFILGCDHNNLLLPTIHSRCFRFFLAIPLLEQSLIWLKSYFPQYHDNELACALLLNENAPFAALALLEIDNWQKRKLFCDKLSLALTNHDFWSLAAFFDMKSLIVQINWFCTLLTDALKAQQKAGRFIINRDQVPLVRMLASYRYEKINALYDLWCDTRQHLMQVVGLNKELILYNLLAQSELIIN